MTKSKLMADFLITLIRLSILTNKEAELVYRYRNRIRGLDVNDV
jgi:hypothetical protein